MSIVEQKLVRVFEHQDIDFIQLNNEPWITADALAKGLDLGDYRQVHKIYSRHQQVIEPYQGVVKLSTPGGIQDVRVFNQTGALAIILFSKSPTAVPFQKWVLEVLDQIRKTGKYLPAEIEKELAKNNEQLRVNNYFLSQRVNKLEKIIEKLDIVEVVSKSNNQVYRMIRFFRDNPNTQFNYNQIVEEFITYRPQQITQFLRNLLTRQIIIRVEPGLYQLNPDDIYHIRGDPDPSGEMNVESSVEKKSI